MTEATATLDRKTYLGGHDIAAICGKSEWRTPFDVWLEKTGKAQPIEINERMQWGQILEGEILKEWGRRNDHVIDPGGFRFDRAEPWRAGHADAIGVPRAGNVRLLETKAVGLGQLPIWNQGIPVDYQYQAQHYLLLYDLDLCTFPVLFGGQRLLDFHLEADAITQHEIREVSRAFWHDYVLKDTAPPGDSVEHAGHQFGTREATPTERQALQEIAIARSLGNSAESRATQALENLKEWARDVTLTVNGKVVAEWKDTERKAYVVPAKSYRSLNLARFTTLAKVLNIDLAPSTEEP